MSKCFCMVNMKKLSEWCWLSDKNIYYVFTRMLFKANYESKQWRDIVIGRGQLVCGVESYAAELGFSTQSFRTILKKLKKTGDIELKSTNKFTIITICNYDSWVCFNSPNNTETNKQTNNQLTNDQQTTNNNIIIEELNKQIEELKKELTNVSKKKERSSVFVKPTFEEVATYVLEKGYHFDAERFHSYYESNGWMVGKNKMKDWKAACKTWENTIKKESPSLFDVQSQEKDPTIPNMDKYEPDLPYDKTMCAFLVPNKYPDLNEDWPYTPNTRPDGARICNGSNGWRWDAQNKRWIEMLWIMDKRQWIDR